VPEINNESKSVLNEMRDSDVANVLAKVKDVVEMLNGKEWKVDELGEKSKKI